MQTRRKFLLQSTLVATGAALLPELLNSAAKKVTNPGIQLYTFRKEMAADPRRTLEQIASIGIKQIESAGSDKGNYYGLTGLEMKKACADLGMTLRSGHIHLDDQWQQTLENAAAAGQEYLICSTMPTSGQTVDNYKKVAATFNKAGEECSKMGLKFGYHNHEYEFETNNNEVLYDVLLDNTDPQWVNMELDLGWVIVAGKDPIDYFKKYKGRFPLWHLKDMDMQHKRSTEFGKGGLNIKSMLQHQKISGLKYFFIEQEEYTSNPMDSMKENMTYLSKLKF